MVERTRAELGRIDILVNNAGINIRKAPHSLELEEWTSVIDTTAAIRSWPEALQPKQKAPAMPGLQVRENRSDQYFATTAGWNA
jgi:NAD(P)-dependent dehydrogenase (short-subunit alcohol dehydrogenase family)